METEATICLLIVLQEAVIHKETVQEDPVAVQFLMFQFNLKFVEQEDQAAKEDQEVKEDQEDQAVHMDQAVQEVKEDQAVKEVHMDQ